MANDASTPSADEFSEMQVHAEQAAQFLKQLSHPQRLLVLCALSQKEMSVGELNACIPLSQSALSQHLASLRQADLVKTRKSAQTVYYSIANPDSLRVVALLQEIFC